MDTKTILEITCTFNLVMFTAQDEGSGLLHHAATSGVRFSAIRFGKSKNKPNLKTVTMLIPDASKRREIET